MVKNPYINALLAAGYIVCIVLTIQFFTKVLPPKDTIFIPMTMLSLFVLSAAVMGFLFVYKPATLYLENKKHEAVEFFAKTVGMFAFFVLIFVVLLLSFPG